MVDIGCKCHELLLSQVVHGSVPASSPQGAIDRSVKVIYGDESTIFILIESDPGIDDIDAPPF